MKFKNKSMWSLKRLVTLSLALIIALTMFSPITAEAKTKNVKVKSLSYTSSIKAVKKKAAKIGTGTTNLTFKKVNSWGQGYVKFTAPKTKKYTFTLSNLRDKNGKYTNGHMTSYRIVTGYKSSYLSSLSMKSKSGSYNFMGSKQKERPSSYKH